MGMSAVRHVCIDKLYVSDPYALVIPIPKRLGAGACAWEALPHSFAPSTQKVYHTYECWHACMFMSLAVVQNGMCLGCVVPGCQYNAQGLKYILNL